MSPEGILSVVLLVIIVGFVLVGVLLLHNILYQITILSKIKKGDFERRIGDRRKAPLVSKVPDTFINTYSGGTKYRR